MTLSLLRETSAQHCWRHSLGGKLTRVSWQLYMYEAEFMKVTISSRFLDLIVRVLRLEVSIYNVYISDQLQTTFARGGGGEWGV